MNKINFTFSLSELLNELKVISFYGNESVEINNIAQLNQLQSDEHSLFWCNDQSLNKLSKMTGTVICSSKIEINTSNKHLNIITVDKPRKEFIKVLKFVTKDDSIEKISSSSKILSNIDNSANLFIGENVIVEKDCSIGNNVSIGHNSVILANTIIGDNVKIGSNCTIGGVGFGYEKDDEGNYTVMPHIGNVWIKNNVEIGNNTCIDRAVLGSTLIGENVKIDNLVHIAHGVQIGANSLIIANAMVAGSVTIGENVWVAPSTSIINGKTIYDNALLGIGSVVLKDVQRDEIIVGNPGKSLKKND